MEDLQKFLGSVPPLILKQVHSSSIVSAESPEQGESFEGDGWLTVSRGIPVLIQTADCVPLFFWNREQTKAGILHIGWRGLCAGMVNSLKIILGRPSLHPGEFCFFFGPCIERDCYEVGPDLADRFQSIPGARDFFMSETDRAGNRKVFLDMKGLIASLLIEWGASAEDMEDSRLCTFCSSGRFPSYRRDGKTGERIFNFLLLK